MSNTYVYSFYFINIAFLTYPELKEISYESIILQGS